MNELAPTVSGTRLRLYEAARAALAEARRVDEVKNIRDQAVAMQEYARQAKDLALLADATEIRFRAEQQAGDMLARMPKNKGAEGTGSNQYEVRLSTETAPPTLAALGITKTQSSRWQKLAALPPDKFEIRVEHAKARVAGMTTSAPSYSKAQYTGENEWFTPEPWLELAREALGEIDLDPASHPLAQERVRAARFFTASDNGLEQPWTGRVWLNPPYCRALLAPFVAKLVGEYARGAVTQAILLTHNYTDTDWFHTAGQAAQAICLPRGRIHFVSPAGDECSPTQGQAFFYFGSDMKAFQRVFARIGLIWRAADSPP